MLLLSKTKSHVRHYMVITLVDTRHIWKFCKNPLLSCLRQLGYALLRCVLIFGSPTCWLLTLWLPLLLSLLLIVLALMQPNLCYVRMLVGCMFSNGDTISELWCRDETESLLWRATQVCATWHALVLRFLVMIHYRTTPMCYFHESSSLIISPYLVKRSVRRTRYHRTSFWSRPTVNLWRTCH